MRKDIELHKRIDSLKFIRLSHLDLKAGVFDESKIESPIEQLLSINSYKHPRGKLKCIINCAAIIFDNLRINSKKEEPGADQFFPGWFHDISFINFDLIDLIDLFDLI